ncbi:MULTISPECIES: hypothetical protein [Agrobacterium]|uniref:hypothetical protein n=1 Tax=Agrobacterium TaxID=357 RepID=UPI002301DABB|nr:MULTISPECIES: hypothetical protein [Agrobacterium]MDA5639374.1 hypothetical protein [Agrobacterium sp. ST15.13.013]MDA6999335.1 hypothetical protein [Agrobacterium salinitolerans]
MSDSGIPVPEGPTELIDTTYMVGQDNITPRIGPFGLDVHNPVFLISGLTIVGFVLLTLALQQYVGPLFSALRDWLTATFDWLLICTES